ncbi:Protein SOSEKI 1 [Coemansia guatemalensis]|uniref:Protein SOSEKI 1 n=1 Tax=Coemansia guatemalensis TaxID=2761395 RepID=A0A9W8LWY2_9FUNG|nr:Protein SOSEKI 1 [Coemansia guatemalensis]
MTESYAAQDSDYLAAHRRPPATARREAAGFLATEATDTAQSNAESDGQRSDTQAAGGAPTSAPCTGGVAGTAGGGDRTTAAAAAGDAASQSAGSQAAGGRGIKRRGSDSCIVLMAVGGARAARKRRSLEAPALAGGLRRASASAAALSTATPSACTAAGKHALPEPTQARAAAQQPPGATPGSSARRGARAGGEAAHVTARGPPPINRYTLRELRVHSILQNARLRHEVVFEPKLEFRPNAGGAAAEAKQRAAQQYWAAVERDVRAGGIAGAATVAALVAELREVVAEMCDDAGRTDVVRAGGELRARLDDARMQQQLAHGVFDAVGAAAALADALRRVALPARHSAIARVVAYVERGRVARGLRGAFDVAEAVKIDAANASIEQYRAYMRATAVAFERAHFAAALRRSGVAVSDAAAWWRDVMAAARAQGLQRRGLRTVFLAAARDLLLDDSRAPPALFRMDDARITTLRREAERLAVVATVALALAQFVRGLPRCALQLTPARVAAECLTLVPEGCTVRWAEPPRPEPQPVPAGDVGFSRLLPELLALAERSAGRALSPAEAAALERALLRAARHECPLRAIVEDRVAAAVRAHCDALAAADTRLPAAPADAALPPAAADALRRAMLPFLAPLLAPLATRIHAVLVHHWLVYKPFYASVSSVTRSAGDPVSAADLTAEESSASSISPL